MELISQHAKRIMEGCSREGDENPSRNAGMLRFAQKVRNGRRPPSPLMDDRFSGR